MVRVSIVHNCGLTRGRNLLGNYKPHVIGYLEISWILNVMLTMCQQCISSIMLIPLKLYGQNWYIVLEKEF